MRRLSDGTIVFSLSDVPDELPGYERDETDPLVFRPAPVSCVHRERRQLKMACGKIRPANYCVKLNIPFVERTFCNSCTEDKTQ